MELILTKSKIQKIISNELDLILPRYGLSSKTYTFGDFEKYNHKST